MRTKRWLAALALLTPTLCPGGVEAAPAKGTPLFIELPREALAADAGAGGFVVAGTYYRGGGFHRGR